jgi:hypothetical protein
MDTVENFCTLDLTKARLCKPGLAEGGGSACFVSSSSFSPQPNLDLWSSAFMKGTFNRQLATHNRQPTTVNPQLSTVNPQLAINSPPRIGIQ